MRFGLVWILSLTLVCLPGCSDEPNCGDGTHDEDGVCVADTTSDGGVKDGKVGTADADASGAFVCGNGKLEGNEKCDDGNQNDHDACLKTCQKNTCGDKFIYYGKEQCDDGNTDNTDYCISTCQIARCGDGFIWKGHEDCDDGNNLDNDKCPGNCRKGASTLPGKVSGRVVRFGLSSSAGITVSLDDSSHSTKTATDGTFSFTGVTAGIYNLSAKYPSYQDGTFKNITVMGNATYQVPDIVLWRSELIDTSASWAGLSEGDKYVAWIDIAGTLRQRATSGGKKLEVAQGVTTVTFVNGKKHLAYRNNKGELYIVAAGSTTPVKVTSNYSSHWLAKTDGWLLVLTSKKKLLFASPDGKTIHSVTDSYLSYSSLSKTQRILVWGTDGLYSLPRAGGKPVELDVSKSTVYCGTSTSQSSTCTSWSPGVSADHKWAYYMVQDNSKVLVRSVDTTTGSPVKLMELSWTHTSMSASLYRFGTAEHVMLRESGTKSGNSWYRLRLASLAGSKEVQVGEYWAKSGNKWYSRVVYSPDGTSVAVEDYDYSNSSHRKLTLHFTDGSSSKTIYSDARYVRHLSYSTDGKRLVYVIRPYSSSNYQLRTIKSDGTGNQTHVSSMGSYYSYYNFMPFKTELLFTARPSSSTYQVRRVSYTSSSPTTLASCDSSASLYTVSDSSAIFRCYSSGTYTLYLYRGGQASAKSLISGSSVSHSLAPDKKSALVWSYSSSAYNYKVADMTTGTSTWVAQALSGSYSNYWVKLPSAAYNFYLRPSSSSSHLSVLCGEPKTGTVKVLGKTRSTPYSITTKAGDRYLLFADTSGATNAKVLGAIDGCKALKVHTGANSYSGSYYLTPDKASVVFLADATIQVVTLAGGTTSKQLASQGSIKLLLSKHLLYSGYAQSPTGTIAAVLAVPLAGGVAVPIDYSLGSPWPGTKDLLYKSSGLRYLKMP